MFIPKKIYLFIFTVVVSLLVAAAVSAQVSNQGLIPMTAEDLALINSQPEVYAKDLVLNTTSYKAGDVVKGSFTLLNGRDIPDSNVSYRVFLVSDLMPDGFYKHIFDNQVLGDVFLDKNEAKQINFEYKLPISSVAYTLGKQIGIQIRAFSGSGTPLGWTDAKISVIDSGTTPITITSSSVVVDGALFALNSGPMVYKDKNGKVSLKVTLANDSDKEITGLTPKISIYDMDYARSALTTYSDSEFSMGANSKQDFNFDLPTFGYTPRVYAGQMVVADKDGINRTGPLMFRYIVYGEVVNIRNVFTDRLSAKVGESVGVVVDYSGSPYDIETNTSTLPTPSDFSLKLFNEKNELVAKYSDKTNFVELGEKDIKLTLSKDADAFSVDVVVSKNGEIITEYKTSFPPEKKTVFLKSRRK